MGELELNRVVAELGGVALFLAADVFHLFVGELGVGAGARRSTAIGDDHPAEGLVLRVVEAVTDRVVGEDLDVVLVGGDAEMRHPGQCGGGVFTGGHKYVGARLRELHGERGLTTVWAAGHGQKVTMCGMGRMPMVGPAS